MEEEKNAKEDEEVSTVVKRLLRLQCIFMFEKEIETLKNRSVLREVNDYIQNTKVVNFNRILLTIVKCFTEKYFDIIKRELIKTMKKVPYLMGGEDVESGMKILNKCLIVLEKRMFEHLYNELNDEPLNYLTIFNMFNLDFVKREERYKIFFDEILKIKLEDGHTDDKSVTVKCINIFDLIKYVYYNAVIDAKKVLSQRIFKQFIEETVIKDMRKGNYVEDPCEKLMKRARREKPINKEQVEGNKQLNIVEHLIKEMWNCLPNLKNPICLKKELFSNQLNEIIDEPVDICNSMYEDFEDNEIINWNYLVTRDGETLYLNAPTYKCLEDFRPGFPRVFEYKPEITDDDFDRAFNILARCHKQDIFDIKLDTILTEGKLLVSDEMYPEKRPKNERIMSFMRARNKVKKRQLIKNEIWNQFQKKYFTFEEDEAEETKEEKCLNSIRPHEFFDLIPQFLLHTVAPIKFEFENFKFICAACGYFIPKGTGVQALGHKWHNEHFQCRVCCCLFTEPTEFILYRGIVLCMYDAENMFTLSTTPPPYEEE